MSTIQIEASRIINAPAAAVYALLSDYRVGHPSILPKPYFEEMTVEEGGRGAGTTGRLRMKTFGKAQDFRMVVTEPEPGRVLLESYPEAGVSTAFTFDPLHGPDERTRLVFTTQMRTSGGIKGLFERLFAPPLLRRIYRKEFDLIEEHFRSASG
jgi:hypothetical protein